MSWPHVVTLPALGGYESQPQHCYDRKAAAAGEDCNGFPGAHHCAEPDGHKGGHRCFCGVEWGAE